MLSIAHDAPLASADLWAAVVGLRSLDEALEAARRARIEVASLCDATRWQSKAVGVLRQAITEVYVEVDGVCSELDIHRDRVARVIW